MKKMDDVPFSSGLILFLIGDILETFLIGKLYFVMSLRHLFLLSDS